MKNACEVKAVKDFNPHPSPAATAFGFGFGTSAPFSVGKPGHSSSTTSGKRTPRQSPKITQTPRQSVSLSLRRAAASSSARKEQHESRRRLFAQEESDSDESEGGKETENDEHFDDKEEQGVPLPFSHVNVISCDESLATSFASAGLTSRPTSVGDGKLVPLKNSRELLEEAPLPSASISFATDSLETVEMLADAERGSTRRQIIKNKEDSTGVQRRNLNEKVEEQITLRKSLRSAAEEVKARAESELDRIPGVLLDAIAANTAEGETKKGAIDLEYNAKIAEMKLEIGHLENERDSKKLEVGNKCSDFKATANDNAKIFTQSWEQRKEAATKELTKINQQEEEDLVPVQSMMKAADLGHQALDYKYVSVDQSKESSEQLAFAERASDIKDRLIEKIQPAIVSGDIERMKRDVLGSNETLNRRMDMS